MKLLLPLTVYRSALGDCTNGGVTSKADTIYLEDEEGWLSPVAIDPALIFRAERNVYGSQINVPGAHYHRLIPVHPEASGINPDKMCGPMAGGNLASTSDSRGKGYTYHVHDRWETWEQTLILSR